MFFFKYFYKYLLLTSRIQSGINRFPQQLFLIMKSSPYNYVVTPSASSDAYINRIHHYSSSIDDDYNLQMSSVTTKSMSIINELTNTTTLNNNVSAMVKAVPKLQFTVVFQAIEIQRLQQALKLSEAKWVDNDRITMQQRTYETRIKELTARCTSLEHERQEQKKDMETLSHKFKQLCSTLQENKLKTKGIDSNTTIRIQQQEQQLGTLRDDLYKWKQKYTQLQESRALDIEQHKRQWDQENNMIRKSQMQSSYHISSDRNLKQYKEQIERMKATISKQNQQLITNSQDIDAYNQQLTQLEQENNLLEEKFVLLTQENLRLNQQMKRKLQEIDVLKGQLGNVAATAKQGESKLTHYTLLMEQHAQQQRELSETQTRLSKLQSHTRNYQQCIKKLTYTETLLSKTKSQLTETTKLLESKSSQADKLQRLVGDIQLQSTTMNVQLTSQLEGKLSTMATRNAELASEVQRFTMETNRKDSLISQLNIRCQTIPKLETECQGLTNRLAAQNRQIALLQQELNNTNKKAQNLSRSQKELVELHFKNQQLQKDNVNLNGILANYERQSAAMVQKYNKMRQQNIKMKNINDQNYQTQINMNQLSSKLQSTINILSHKTAQLTALSERCNELQNAIKANSGFEGQVRQQVATMSKLLMSLDSANQELAALQHQLTQSQNVAAKMKATCSTLDQRCYHQEQTLNAQANQLTQLNSVHTELLTVQLALKNIYKRYSQQQLGLDSLKLDLSQSHMREQVSQKLCAGFAETLRQQGQLINEAEDRALFITNQLLRLRQMSEQVVIIGRRIAMMGDQTMQENMAHIFNTLEGRYVNALNEIDRLSDDNMELQSNVRRLQIAVIQSKIETRQSSSTNEPIIKSMIGSFNNLQPIQSSVVITKNTSTNLIAEQLLAGPTKPEIRRKASPQCRVISLGGTPVQNLHGAMYVANHSQNHSSGRVSKIESSNTNNIHTNVMTPNINTTNTTIQNNNIKRNSTNSTNNNNIVPLQINTINDTPTTTVTNSSNKTVTIEGVRTIESESSYEPSNNSNSSKSLSKDSHMLHANYGINNNSSNRSSHISNSNSHYTNSYSTHSPNPLSYLYKSPSNKLASVLNTGINQQQLIEKQYNRNISGNGGSNNIGVSINNTNNINSNNINNNINSNNNPLTYPLNNSNPTTNPTVRQSNINGSLNFSPNIRLLKIGADKNDNKRQ